ncbi:MAG: hypothetical protein WCD66_09645 [Rhodanobacteraceae bacterium]
MYRPTLRIAVPLLGLLMLAACGKDQSAQSSASANNEPASAVMNQVKLLDQGKIDALVKASLPPADYQAVRQKFVEQQQDQGPITEKQRKDFAEKMKELSAPDAEQSLFKQLSPVLKQYDSKYKAQLPMYIGMGQTMMTTAINQSKDMTPEQKKQAGEMLSAAAQWAQSTDWGNEDKAKQAIAVVTSTVRKLDVKTLEQARAMSYDEAMAKYGQVWMGVRKIFKVYGADIDKALASVKAKTLSQADHKATVEISYSLFDKPMKSQIHMMERDGHWYNANLVTKLEKSMAEDKAAAASSAAASASAPAVASSAD